MYQFNFKTLGTANFVISVTEQDHPATLLFLTFLACAVISFFTGTSWGHLCHYDPHLHTAGIQSQRRRDNESGLRDNCGGNRRRRFRRSLLTIVRYNDFCPPGRRIRPHRPYQDTVALCIDGSGGQLCLIPDFGLYDDESRSYG